MQSKDFSRQRQSLGRFSGAGSATQLLQQKLGAEKSMTGRRASQKVNSSSFDPLSFGEQRRQHLLRFSHWASHWKLQFFVRQMNAGHNICWPSSLSAKVTRLNDENIALILKYEELSLTPAVYWRRPNLQFIFCPLGRIFVRQGRFAEEEKSCATSVPFILFNFSRWITLFETATLC